MTTQKDLTTPMASELNWLIIEFYLKELLYISLANSARLNSEHVSIRVALDFISHVHTSNLAKLRNAPHSTMCDKVWRENTEAKLQRPLASQSTAFTNICLIDARFDQILPRVI